MANLGIRNANAHITIRDRDEDYRRYLDEGVSGLLIPGISCAQACKILNDPAVLAFQKANKHVRHRMRRSGKISFLTVSLLKFRDTLLGKKARKPVTTPKKTDLEWMASKKLRPLLKWPGGKTSDINHICQKQSDLFPIEFENYYEPFLGGGAFWLTLNSQYAHRMYVNDFCPELIEFYRSLRDQDEEFFQLMDAITLSWDTAKMVSDECCQELYDIKSDDIKKVRELAKPILDRYRQKLEGNFFCPECSVDYFETVTKVVTSKLSNIERAEKRHNSPLPSEDIPANIEGAFKAALYTQIRDIMNSQKEVSALKVAAFYCMRDYCFSSMFRYNSNGEFNVPYGGLSYNSRSPNSKKKMWQHKDVVNHLRSTEFFNLDFEDFLKKTNPKKDDFVFLDPPYDSEFSTYAENAFSIEDQKRLADFMIDQTDAQFMAVMKATPDIRKLWDRKRANGVVVAEFDKNYSVSFKNRNEKAVKHLVVLRLNK